MVPRYICTNKLVMFQIICTSVLKTGATRIWCLNVSNYKKNAPYFLKLQEEIYAEIFEIVRNTRPNVLNCRKYAISCLKLQEEICAQIFEIAINMHPNV